MHIYIIISILLRDIDDCLKIVRLFCLRAVGKCDIIRI